MCFSFFRAKNGKETGACDGVFQSFFSRGMTHSPCAARVQTASREWGMGAFKRVSDGTAPYREAGEDDGHQPDIRVYSVMALGNSRTVIIWV